MEENICKALFLAGVNVTPEQFIYANAWKNKVMSLSNSSVGSKDKMSFLIEKIDGKTNLLILSNYSSWVSFLRVLRVLREVS